MKEDYNPDEVTAYEDGFKTGWKEAIEYVRDTLEENGIPDSQKEFDSLLEWLDRIKEDK